MHGVNNSTSTSTSTNNYARRVDDSTTQDVQRTPPPPPPTPARQDVVDSFESSGDTRNLSSSVANRVHNREPPMPSTPAATSATSSLYATTQPQPMQTITGDMPTQGPTQNPLVDQAIDKTTTALAGQMVNKPVEGIQQKIDETTAAINGLPADKRAAAAGASAQVLSDTAAKLPQAYIDNQKDAVWDVKEGDTLTSIAANYVDPNTNQPLTPAALAAENAELTGDASSKPPRTEDGSMIYPGERVDIPAGYIPVTENALLKQQQAALNASAAKLAAVAQTR